MSEILNQNQKMIEALKEQYSKLSAKELQKIIGDKDKKYGANEYTAAQIMLDKLIAERGGKIDYIKYHKNYGDKTE